jgi:hypothetical protein
MQVSISCIEYGDTTLDLSVDETVACDAPESWLDHQELSHSDIVTMLERLECFETPRHSSPRQPCTVFTTTEAPLLTKEVTLLSSPLSTRSTSSPESTVVGDVEMNPHFFSFESEGLKETACPFRLPFRFGTGLGFDFSEESITLRFDDVFDDH